MTDSETDSGFYDGYDRDRTRDGYARDDRAYDGYGRGEGQAEKERRFPLAASVLLADLAIGVVAFVLLIVISVQRYGYASKSLQNTAYIEALLVVSVVAALFVTAAVLLLRSGYSRVGVMQGVIAAVMVVAGVFAVVQGRPGAHPQDTIPIEQITDDNVAPAAPSSTS